MPKPITTHLLAPDTGPAPAVTTTDHTGGMAAVLTGAGGYIALALATAILGGLTVYLLMRKTGKTDFSKHLMYVPLLLVNAAAIYGQVAFFYENVAPGTWQIIGRLALAAIIAGAVESMAVYVGWHAHDALLNKAGSTAARLRRASYVIAGLVASINYAHFADFTDRTGNTLGANAASVAFGLLSLLSPWLWGLHTRRMQHVQLTKEGAVDATGATFSVERIRSFPIRSAAARRWSIDNYVTDPQQAWLGYNTELRARWADTVDSPTWWMRTNPIARVKQLTAAVDTQRELTAQRTGEVTALTGKLTDAEKTLTVAGQTITDQTGRITQLVAERNALTGELEAARSEVEDLTGRLTEMVAETAAVKTELDLTGKRLAEETGALRAELTAQAERLTSDHRDEVRRLTDKHRADIAAARAVAKTVSLTDYRTSRTGKGAPAPTGKAELSDEAAVQMMLTAHTDPSHEWSKNAVRTLTGVGVGRAPKLIDMWLTAATEQAAGGDTGQGQAVNQ